MLTSEYSSSLACSSPFSNLANIVRSEAISSALALSHGFAYGRAADAEIQREPPLVEADIGATAIDVHADDGVLERGIGSALEAVRTADALDAWRYRSARGMGRGCGA